MNEHRLELVDVFRTHQSDFLACGDLCYLHLRRRPCETSATAELPSWAGI